MVYLLMPDRFANGDPTNDSTPDTEEKADRDAFFGRYGGDLLGRIDHLDFIADLGATTIWPTPLQLMIHGADIASYDLTIEGGKGVTVGKVHKAESSNYLFADITIASNAQPGTYWLVFTKGDKTFKDP